MVAPLTPAALAPRIFRPERPRLAGTRSKAREVLLDAWTTDAPWMDPEQSPERWVIADADLEAQLAQQVWEAVAPVAWVGDAHRRFAADDGDDPEWRMFDDGDVEGAVARHRTAPYPTTLRDAIVLAGDPDGMATAEALAKEFASRTARFGCAQPATVVWWVEPPRGLAPWRRDRAPWSALRDLLFELASDAKVPRPPSAAVPRNLIPHDAARADAELARAWRDDCRYGAVYRGTPLASLPDPFEPLMAIWALGYALYSVDRDALVLVTPGL